MIRLFIILFLATSLIIFIFQRCDDDRQSFGEGLTIAYSEEDYIGELACTSCHNQEYDLWHNSHHALAMLPANDTTVLGNFNNAKFDAKGVKSSFKREDGRYIVRTQGPEDSIMDFEVKYTFGWTPLQQYLVEIPNGEGRLQALHIAWDSELQEWFDLYPTDTFPTWDWMHWTNNAMTWNSMCADCHSTNLNKNYSPIEDSYNTTWSAVNVSCEACHGPGRSHVDYVNSINYDSLKPLARSYLHLTKGIPSIEQIEQCAVCHSRRSSITNDYDHSGRFMDHFIPNVLSNNLYFGDGQILEEDYVYGSFLQSKMFQNGVKCTDCHDPHSGKLKQTGNNLCLSCHISNKYSTPEHHHHPMKSESASCINCHMPGRLYMVNDYRRDHSFRVPRPDLTVHYGTPNACNQCHEDKGAQWAADNIEKWYGPKRSPHYSEKLLRGLDGSEEDLISLVEDRKEPAIVRATAVFYLNNFSSENAYQSIAKALHDNDALVRLTAINALANYPSETRLRMLAPLLNDQIRSVRTAAASVLADLDLNQIPNRYQAAFMLALEEYENMLARNEDFPAGRFQLGQYYDRKKEDSIAIYHYLKALEKDSLLNAPRLNLARIYSVRKQNEKALKVLQDAIQVEGNNSMAHYSLALILAENEQFEDAADSFENAALYDPSNSRIYYNWGLVKQNLKKYDEAIEIYTTGIGIDHAADDIRYALVTAYFESGQYDKALSVAEHLLKKYPDNSSLVNLVRNIKARIGV